MKKRVVKSLLSVLLALLLAFTISGGRYVSAEDGTAAASSVLYSGSCGDDAEWTLDSAGVLTISGTGAITQYNGSAYYP